jgi:hypothetical protein
MIYVEQYDKNDSSMFNMHTENYEYGIGEVTIAYSTLDQGWSDSAKGQIAASLDDNGNRVKVTFDNGKKIKLDYAQAQELYLLLKYYNEDSGLVGLNPSILKLKEV